MKLSKSFRNEFGDTKELKRQLSNKYREKRQKIESFMGLSYQNDPYYTPIFKALFYKENKVDKITNF